MAEIDTITINNVDYEIVDTATRTAIANHKNITISTSEPTAAQGENNDVWIVYEA